MTVNATVTSTLNGQTAELVVIERGENHFAQARRTLSGGTETFNLTELDGGERKNYSTKVELATNNVTQTAQVPYNVELDVDKKPHEGYGQDRRIRDDTLFSQGLSVEDFALPRSGLTQGLLTTALNDGEVLSDDGFVYSSIQSAEQSASSWIFAGPGTFTENVTINTDGLAMFACGDETIIDGGSGDCVTIQASNVAVQHFKAVTTGGSAVRDGTGASDLLINDVTGDCGGNAIQISVAGDVTVSNCDLTSSGGHTISFGGTAAPQSTIYNNTVDGSGATRNAIQHRASGGDHHILGNLVLNAGEVGINTDANDTVIGGNRVINSGTDGVLIFGTDQILFNNRISDSGGADIQNNATTPVIDDNRTGVSN